MSKARNRQPGAPRAVLRWSLVPVIAGFVLLGGCSKAATQPKFEADVQGNTLTIYSNAREPDTCTVSARFSIARNGKREMASHICQNCKIEVGTHIKISDITDDLIVDGKIERIDTQCKSDRAEQNGAK